MSVDQSQVMNTLLRMVVPLRREFGRNLDVKNFLHDFEYAREILAQALASRDQRLREYAQYVDKLMSGPRGAEAPAPPRAAAPARDEGPPSVIERLSPGPALARKAAAGQSDEEDLRKKIMQKYTAGLR